MEDPGAAARLFKDFAKDNEAFEVKALAVSGQMLGAEQLDVWQVAYARSGTLNVDECYESAGDEAGSDNERSTWKTGSHARSSTRSERGSGVSHCG